MVMLREKLRQVLWVTQPGREVEAGALFSQEQCIHPTLLMAHKRLLYVDHVRYEWSMAIRGLSVKNVWHVGRVFSCMMCIDSNHRDSRI
jgi:hypothetical protein